MILATHYRIRKSNWPFFRFPAFPQQPQKALAARRVAGGSVRIVFTFFWRSTMSAPWSALSPRTTAGTAFELQPAGSLPAVCVGIIDLGTHEAEFRDRVKNSTRKRSYRYVALVWELTSEPRVSIPAKNHLISRHFPLTFSDKSGLRLTLQSWRGKTYAAGDQVDLAQFLGKPCMLTIARAVSTAGNAFAKITACGPVPRGMAVPPPKVTPFVWQIGDAPIETLAVYPQLPFVLGMPLKEKIARSREATGQPVTAEQWNAEQGGQSDDGRGDTPF
jgi:hypothetical protein